MENITKHCFTSNTAVKAAELRHKIQFSDQNEWLTTARQKTQIRSTGSVTLPHQPIQRRYDKSCAPGDYSSSAQLQTAGALNPAVPVAAGNSAWPLKFTARSAGTGAAASRFSTAQLILLLHSQQKLAQWGCCEPSEDSVQLVMEPWKIKFIT